MKAVKPGIANAIYYWYDLDFTENLRFSTLDSSYYKKCCFILGKPKDLENNLELTVCIKVQQFILKIVLND